MNPLKKIGETGQSIWLDFVRHSLIEKGDLKRLIDEDGLKGVTSNPSIFEKAIGGSDEYDAALRTFQGKSDHSVSEIYEYLAVGDIRAAADVLKPVYDSTKGVDGYISLECSPYLANDTKGTVEEALRLWKTVGKPNLMVKVPATPAGIPAIQELIAHGLNINVTLIFSLPVYEQVVEAYMAGLEKRAAEKGHISKIASVASFFVSRIDTAVDKKLDELTDKAAADRLRSKVAIANAKVAYARYGTLFGGNRWEALAKQGAKPQRLLWASTSVKNKSLKDTMYVEALIGKDTVDTVPPETLDAFRDHGDVAANALSANLDAAHATLEDLKKQGISLEEVTQKLTRDGVQLFADSFDKLLGAVARRRLHLIEGEQPRFSFQAGSEDLKKAVDDEMEHWRKDGKIRRLWEGDASLWTNADESKWLGWLTIADSELNDLGKLEAFAKKVKAASYSDVVLLGMGGSSLGPEVLSETFGNAPGFPRFHMLDSTDPQQVRDIDAAIDLKKTLFIVSSKSGGTLEPNIFMAYFLERLSTAIGKAEAAQRFVAVTDPKSSMETEAKKLGFGEIFYGLPSIGGRYSVLSKFGLVPGAAIGLDLRQFLENVRIMERSCGPEVPPDQNPGIQLGLAMGVAATKFGRDKITIFASPKIEDIGSWLEQLIAESTGKQGKGLIPVAGEPLASPDAYGKDRFFAYLELDGDVDPQQKAAIDAIEKAGHPVARIRLKTTLDIGQEFFRWEMATAVASVTLELNPFDQPDVEASKVKTKALTDAFEKSRNLPKEEPIFRENGISLFADPKNAADLGRHNALTSYLKSHFERVKGGTEKGDYVGLLAYIDHTDANTTILTEMRKSLRDRTKAATCVGFGPRFQHSTGQAYKGGPNSGVFLQITCDDKNDVAVPGHAYSFGIVKAAQARGDLEVLVERNRRALRVHLKDVDQGLVELARAVEEALPTKAKSK